MAAKAIEHSATWVMTKGLLAPLPLNRGQQIVELCHEWVICRSLRPNASRMPPAKVVEEMLHCRRIVSICRVLVGRAGRYWADQGWQRTAGSVPTRRLGWRLYWRVRHCTITCVRWHVCVC